MSGSEYGGDPGIIQSSEARISDAGNAAAGHSELTVNEQLMVSGRAMKKEKDGVPKQIIRDPQGRRTGVVPYDEAQALEDYTTGNNY